MFFPSDLTLKLLDWELLPYDINKTLQSKSSYLSAAQFSRLFKKVKWEIHSLFIFPFIFSWCKAEYLGFKRNCSVISSPNTGFHSRTIACKLRLLLTETVTCCSAECQYSPLELSMQKFSATQSLRWSGTYLNWNIHCEGGEKSVESTVNGVGRAKFSVNTLQVAACSAAFSCLRWAPHCLREQKREAEILRGSSE